MSGETAAEFVYDCGANLTRVAWALHTLGINPDAPVKKVRREAETWRLRGEFIDALARDEHSKNDAGVFRSSRALVDHLAFGSPEAQR